MKHTERITWSFSISMHSCLSSFLGSDASFQDAVDEDQQVAGADAVIGQHPLHGRL